MTKIDIILENWRNEAQRPTYSELLEVQEEVRELKERIKTLKTIIKYNNDRYTSP